MNCKYCGAPPVKDLGKFCCDGWECGTASWPVGELRTFSCYDRERDALHAKVKECLSTIDTLNMCLATHKETTAENVDLRAEVAALRVENDQMSIGVMVASERAGKYADEITALHARLAKFEGPLTDEQVAAVYENACDYCNFGDILVVDAAIRAARERVR